MLTAHATRYAVSLHSYESKLISALFYLAPMSKSQDKLNINYDFSIALKLYVKLFTATLLKA